MSFVINLIIIFGALLGHEFPLGAGVSLSDVFCGIALIFLPFQIITGSGLYKDKISKWTFIYFLCLAFAGLLNFTYNQTQYLNYFRIFTEGLILYCFTRNTLTTESRIHKIGFLFLIYTLIFLYTSRNMMTQNMIEATDFHVVSFGYGRNNWGFTNLLCLILCCFTIYKFKFKFMLNKIALCLFPILIFNIYLSASRFSVISLVAFLVFFRFWIGKRISPKEIVFYIIIFIVAPTIISLLFNSVNSNILEESQRVFENKIDDTEDDAFSLRIMRLNVLLIVDAIQHADILHLIFGDGLAITHGVFSQTFLSTGLVGFFVYTFSTFYLIVHYFRKKGVYSLVAIIILIMLANDTVTDARFIIGVNNQLYMIILAYLMSYGKFLESAPKTIGFHSRVCES